MKPLKFIPLDKKKPSCCQPGSDGYPLPHWAEGLHQSPAGEVLKLRTTWQRQDYTGAFKSRVSSYRMKYTVSPGLYAVGSPGPESDVFVSANYKLSFDHLRKGMAGLDAWVLVLDTKGINVWCAAGKGTFGTAELVARIKDAGLSGVVSHRRIIVPQLGAPGINCHEVKSATGFRVSYGPVQASDIRAYMEAGRKATPEMRRVRFALMDRLVLTPMEIVPAMEYFPLFALVALLAAGLMPEGILFARAWEGGGPLLVLGLGAVMAGAFITPLMLPLIPVRPFALKGFIIGLAVTHLLVIVTAPEGALMRAAAYLFFPAASSYIALQFTGSTTFTSMSGVKLELKWGLPLYLAASAGTAILLAAHKAVQWRLV